MQIGTMLSPSPLITVKIPLWRIGICWSAFLKIVPLDRVMLVSDIPCITQWGDLRFITESGEELKYEIANWNTAGESQVWVRVSSLASDANFTAYWGNANAGMPSYANDGSVWDGYFGVYHLEGGTGTAKDSSSLGNDLPGKIPPFLYRMVCRELLTRPLPQQIMDFLEPLRRIQKPRKVLTQSGQTQQATPPIGKTFLVSNITETLLTF